MAISVKRSISFAPDLLAEAEEAAREECGGNLSAYVAGAVAHRNKVHAGRALMQRDTRKLGPVPQAVARDVDALWSH